MKAPLFLARACPTIIGLALFAASFTPRTTFALGQAQFIEFSKAPGSFAIVDPSTTVPIYVDTLDWPGVLRAAKDLSSDITAITGKAPKVIASTDVAGPTAIIIGTVGKSTIIDKLAAAGKIDVSGIKG